jgi:hypothetical protein
MPAYKTQAYITSLLPGDSLLAWNAEQPAAGVTGASTSERVALARSPQASQVALGVDGFFAGAPGAFEIDLYVSNTTDTDAAYALAGTITVVDANNNFHGDFLVTAKFARLAMKTRTNAVNVTATVRRS